MKPALPILSRLFLLSLTALAVSCNSMNTIKKGDLIGGLWGVPFEIAGGAVETALVPLGGGTPHWVGDAQVAGMKEEKPLLDDPRWTTKYASQLKAGSIYLPTFEENLKAYKLTKTEKYLSRAEQLATTPAQRSELELQALIALGPKAFDAEISMDGSTASPKYDSRTEKVLFISGKLTGAIIRPKGRATLTLRRDLPFTLTQNYIVSVDFTFTVPRENIVEFMGLRKTEDWTRTGHLVKTFTFGPSQRSASCSLEFGGISGAGTADVLGSTQTQRLTGSPYTSYEIKSIARK